MTPRLVRLNTIQADSVSWLWPNWIPIGGITTFDGDPGNGKSAVIYDLIARLTTGRAMPFTSKDITPAGVVLLQAEDFLAATVRPTLEALGADLQRVLVFDKRQSLAEPIRLPREQDVLAIRQGIEETNARLVIFDPLPSFLKGNPNSEQSMRNALGPLAAIAEEKQVAVVLVRHLTKGRAANPKHRGAGSMGIIAAARSAMLVAHDPDSHDPHRHILTLSKSNLSDAPPLVYRTVKTNGVITVEWIEEKPSLFRTFFGTEDDEFERSQLEDACYALYLILGAHQEPMPAKDVQQEATKALVAMRTLKRAKSRLGIVSRRVKGGDGSWQWVWKLPEDHGQFQQYKDRALRECADDPGIGSPPESEAPASETPTLPLERPWEDASASKANTGTADSEEEPPDDQGDVEGVPVGAGADQPVRPWDE